MSTALPHPKLPPGAQLEVYAYGFYRWRLEREPREPQEPWTYCVGRQQFTPLCQEHGDGKLLVYPLRGTEPRSLNSVLTELGFRGEFHKTRGVISFTSRWPYPPTGYFPGMIIDRKARVLNGTWQEQEDRRVFEVRLKFYVHLLRRYLAYRSTYPLPDENDCTYCQGATTAYRTMYAFKNHLRRHLKNYEIFGALLWNALEAENYADQGKLDVLGYGEGPAQVDILAQAVSRYFKTQGGF